MARPGIPEMYHNPPGGGTGGFLGGSGGFLGGLIGKTLQGPSGPYVKGSQEPPIPEDPAAAPGEGAGAVGPGGVPYEVNPPGVNPLAILFGSPILLAIVGFAVYWFFIRKKR